MDKNPPQATELEEALLGIIMLYPTSIQEIMDIVKPDVFYKNEHEIIYKAILSVLSENNTPDILSVTTRLKNSGELSRIGGAIKLTQLISPISSSANIEYYAAIIYQKYIQRQLIKLANDITIDSYSDKDAFETVNRTIDKLTNLTGFDRANITKLNDIFPDISRQIDKNLLNDKSITGIATGFNHFDSFSGGMQDGDLIILAGETSNGKTSIGLNIALNAAKDNKKIVFYSYEMSKLQLTSRLLAIDSFVSSKEMMYSKLNTADITKIQQSMQEEYMSNIFIDDLTNSSYAYLEKSIRAMVARDNMDLIVIDYLQLIQHSVKGQNKAESVAEIANGLKSLAKTLNVPIILISQMARDRQNPYPTLSRLKGSGDIENAADVIWLTQLPVKYGKDEFECLGQVYASEGNSLHIIAKGRNIGLTEWVMGFNPSLTSYSNNINDNLEPTSNPF